MSTKLDGDYCGLLQFVAETLDHCSPRETQEFLKFLPYSPKNDLGPISLSFLLQVTQTTHTSCHSYAEIHRVEQNISSAAQSVVNTEFRLCFSGCHLVES